MPSFRCLTSQIKHAFGEGFEPATSDFAAPQFGLRLRSDNRDLKDDAMSNGNPLPLSEVEQRIAIVRDNIRQLLEQAAAFSGAEDEDRNADRIAQQQEELDRLIKERDALSKK
jgi:hypothetical protein